MLQEEVRAALDRLFLYEGHTSLEALNDTQVSHIIVYNIYIYICPFEVLNILSANTYTFSLDYENLSLLKNSTLSSTCSIRAAFHMYALKDNVGLYMCC